MERLFESAPKKAQKNIRSRVNQYCLNGLQPQVEELVVTQCAAITLSAAPNEKSYISPVMLETKDLDVLKGWIGVSNELVAGKNIVSCSAQKDMRRFQKSHLSHIDRDIHAASVEQSKDRSQILSAEKGRINDSIREYTKGYLYGDSRPLAELKPLIEAHFEIFRVPLWPFFNVVVKSGATLYFGPGANVLWAHNLEIESGGRVRSTGNLTVSVTNLKKTNQKVAAKV